MSALPAIGRYRITDKPISKSRIFGVNQSQQVLVDLEEIKDWTKEGIRDLAWMLISDDAAQQERLGNPLTAFLTDGSPVKPPQEFQRTYEARFGLGDARPAMKILETAVRRAVDSPGLSWRWIARTSALGAAPRSAPVPSGGPVLFGLLDRYYLIPEGAEVALLPYRNLLRMDGFLLNPDGTWKKIGSSTKKGPMARAASSANRLMASYGLRATVGFSNSAASAVGRAVGPRNTLSRRTGKTAYWQGIPYFKLTPIHRTRLSRR